MRIAAVRPDSLLAMGQHLFMINHALVTGCKMPGPRGRGLKIYECLKDDIAHLKIGTDERMYETDVASRYEGSRTPAREALMRLQQEGLLVREGRAYRVRSFTSAEITDLYDVRESLEVLAVTRATERACDDDLRELKACLGQLDKTVARSDVARFNVLDTRLHLTIAQLAGNAFLWAELAAIHDKVQIIRRRELSRPRGIGPANDEHARIIAAIERRDPTVAAAEMRFHIQSSVANLRALDEAAAPVLAGQGSGASTTGVESGR